MALPKYNGDLNVISSLPDRPNKDLGLTAAQMKQKFEEMSEDMINYVDNVLTPAQDTLNSGFASKTGSETLTGKTIDADDNTITDLTVTNLKSGVLDTDLSSVSANDDTIPSAKATKTALDGKVNNTGNESIAGIKTFTSSPIVPTPTTDMQTSTKKYVDDNIGAVVLGQIPDNSLTDVKLSGTAGQIKPRVATVEGKVTQLETDRGTMASLNTSIKTSLVGAINEVNTGLSNAGGKTDNYYTTTSATGNIGALVLDGTDDYATVPASVGQLTNGTSTFELVVKFKSNLVGQQYIIGKTDTTYSAGIRPKGWQINFNGAVAYLFGTPTNAGTQVNITGNSNIPLNTVTYVKVAFNGITVELSVSFDGMNWVSQGTSTDSNLITALSTSDNVLTQIGRGWDGSNGYRYYTNGTIYSIQLTKSGTLTNRYEFKQFGTNQAVNDTVGTSHGTSAGGAVQGGSSYATFAGIDDYATVPSIVGQLTNGTTSFELKIKVKPTNSSTYEVISKTDTGYSATTNVKGWYLRLNAASNNIQLAGTSTNGVADTTISSSPNLLQLNVYNFIKISFNGTTVTLSHSLDDNSYTIVGTSTNANLIGGLSTSDNVLTQIGRHWFGSGGYQSYLIGDLSLIEVTKNSILTNRYLFTNVGTNTNIIDDISSSNGVSAGGVIQYNNGLGTNYTLTTGKFTALTDNMRVMVESNATAGTAIQPAINIDTLGAKQIIGATMQANKFYELRYDRSIDNFVALAQEEKKVIPTYVLPAAATSFTIPNLDINRDGGMYEIIINNAKHSAGGSLNMFINGDTTTTNYYQIDAGTYINSPSNTAPSTNISTNETTGRFTIMLSGDKVVGTVEPSTIFSSTGGSAMRGKQDTFNWVHKNTQSNVTSLTFTSTANITQATVNIYKR